MADTVNRSVVERYAQRSLDRQLGSQDRVLADVVGSHDSNPEKLIDNLVGDQMMIALEKVEPFGRQVLFELIIEERPLGEVAQELELSVEELQDKLEEALSSLRGIFLGND